MLKKLLSLKIATRLWLIAGCAAIGIVGLTTVFMVSERPLIVSERQNGLRQAVETAHGVVAHYYALSAQGKMPEQDAQHAAIEQVRSLRYSGNEYFFISDLQPRAVMHPIKPELEGKDVGDIKDPTGKRVFVDLANVTKANGAGFVDTCGRNQAHPSPCRNCRMPSSLLHGDG